MGIKFRKRVKLAPGVHLNLSGKGASISVGRKGATVNVGKRGVRASVGLPGTGISYSQLLSSGQRLEKSNALSYPVYMRLSKAERASYRAAGGKVPAGVKLLKFCFWANVWFWGLIVLAVILAKA